MSIPSIVAAQIALREAEEARRRKAQKEKPKGITFGRRNPMPLNERERTERGSGIPKEDAERAASHFGIAPSEVTPQMVEALPSRSTGLERGTARGKLSDGDVERIARAVVERAREDVDVRDVIIGSAMGEGAIPLYGRELRREPCSCCLIDPEGPNEPANRMCSSSACIGLLKDSEEREWCSVINIVPDGRCSRAMAIREAAKECKEEYPEDTAKFFACFTPAFSAITKG